MSSVFSLSRLHFKCLKSALRDCFLRHCVFCVGCRTHSPLVLYRLLQSYRRGVRTSKFLMLTNESVCRPDGVGTVTHEERDKFVEIKERLRVYLEYQITNFR